MKNEKKKNIKIPGLSRKLLSLISFLSIFIPLLYLNN